MLQFSDISIFCRTVGSYRIGHVVCDALAEHGCGEARVNILGVQVVVLAVEHERGRIAAQQIREGFPDHREADHGAVLRDNNNMRSDDQPVIPNVSLNDLMFC